MMVVSGVAPDTTIGRVRMVNRMRLSRILAGPLAAALLAAGCATDDDPAAPDAAETPDDAPADAEHDAEPDDAADDAPEDATDDGAVALRNISFSPESVTVAVGDTVTFTNEDVVRHTVTSGDPGEPDGRFDEDLPDQGDVAEITFDEPGTFVYFCDLHRNMTGEIVVE